MAALGGHDVTIINMFPGFERLIPFMLFALYLLTAVRLCRYSSWIDAGAPNPFLPRRIQIAVTQSEIAQMVHADVRARRNF